MREVDCPACHGARLKPESLAVTVGGRNIYELCSLSIANAVEAMGTLELSDREHMIADRVFKEVRERMQFLLDVGARLPLPGPLGRHALGGEAQRIRLASQIGSGLVGVLYVLDEPSIGLHQRDNQRLIGTLERLRNLGNTVIVVEHDEETIRTADYVVDIGPGAGEHGGTVVHAGPVTGKGRAASNKASITGQYLSGKRSIPVPARRRPGTGDVVTVRGAREHNLHDIDVSFPLGCLVAVTGVSGSGKSTLVNDILLRSLAQQLHRAKTLPGRHRKVEGVQPRQGGRRRPGAHRAHAALEPGHLHGRVRPHPQALRQTAEAKVRGYQPGRFSFNVRGGAARPAPATAPSRSRCTSCPTSTSRARSATAPATTATRSRSRSGARPSPTCSTCRARRRSEFFAKQPPIARHMQTLVDVGLGYVRLGQPAPTSRAARPSGSSWPASSAGGRPGTPSTCSTSPPPVCTSRTPAACSRCWAAWSSRATRSWSSSTTST
jgi:excinuclease ABC subunit A